MFSDSFYDCECTLEVILKVVIVLVVVVEVAAVVNRNFLWQLLQFLQLG